MLKPFLIPVIAAMTVCCAVAGPVPVAEPEPLIPRAIAPGSPTDNEQRRAAELLGSARGALEADDYPLAEELAMQVVTRYPDTSASAPALWVAAQAALERQSYATAAERAELYATLYPEGAAGAAAALELAARARSLIAELEEEDPVSATIGAILPRSGSEHLKEYSELILRGITLAVDQYNQGAETKVRLEVMDDAGNPERAGQLVRDLDRRGALGVVGPLMDAAVGVAARARPDSRMVIVSPTAEFAVTDVQNVYTLGAEDSFGAELLAEHAVAAGLGRAAVLYPQSAEGISQARAFADALNRVGGVLLADMPYEPGTTTFADHLKEILAAEPQSLFIPVAEREVRQIAPQVYYYGLRDVQILGSEAWVSDDLRRVVDPRHLEGTIAATPIYEPSTELGLKDFIVTYEARYRRTLDNLFPALGYDAALLLLAGLDSNSSGREDFALRVAQTLDLRGATGRLTVREGRIVRRPFLVQIQDGELVPVKSSR